MAEEKDIILDDETIDLPDYSPEALEEFRRRTEAGENPEDVARDLNRRRYELLDD